MATVYGIKNCDTVKRARAWLDSHSISYEFHDFKTSGVPENKLGQWSESAGWETLLNRKGTTWRQLDEATRASVVDDKSAQAVMRANASVIKRPVVEWDSGRVSVGFDEATFLERSK